MAFNEAKQRMCHRSDAWGWINDDPYWHRGWCAAEFARARKAGTIANMDEPDVQTVPGARKWPETVDDYAAMMRESTDGRAVVEFTKKGDRDYVAYLFFKMSFDPRDLTGSRDMSSVL